MQAIKQSIATAELLSGIYKSVKNGSELIIGLMSHVNNEKLTGDMTVQLDGYEKFAWEACEMLNAIGSQTKEENIVSKIGVKMSMAMNTMVDSGINHIAKMIIDGSVTNINETVRLIRKLENTDTSEKSLLLAREIIAFEENNIECMKKYIT